MRVAASSSQAPTRLASPDSRMRGYRRRHEHQHNGQTTISTTQRVMRVMKGKKQIRENCVAQGSEERAQRTLWSLPCGGLAHRGFRAGFRAPWNPLCGGRIPCTRHPVVPEGSSTVAAEQARTMCLALGPWSWLTAACSQHAPSTCTLRRSLACSCLLSLTGPLAWLSWSWPQTKSSMRHKRKVAVSHSG